jgi:hypothetical protein
MRFAIRVRKLIGKPAFLTIADCEPEARHIHLSGSLSNSQQGIAQPYSFVLIGCLNRILNDLVLYRINAGAQHDAPRLALWEFRTANLFSFCHTRIVDRILILSYKKSRTKRSPMANNLTTETRLRSRTRLSGLLRCSQSPLVTSPETAVKVAIAAEVKGGKR